MLFSCRQEVHNVGINSGFFIHLYTTSLQGGLKRPFKIRIYNKVDSNTIQNDRGEGPTYDRYHRGMTVSRAQTGCTAVVLLETIFLLNLTKLKILYDSTDLLGPSGPMWGLAQCCGSVLRYHGKFP